MYTSTTSKANKGHNPLNSLKSSLRVSKVMRSRSPSITSTVKEMAKKQVSFSIGSEDITGEEDSLPPAVVDVPKKMSAVEDTTAQLTQDSNNSPPTNPTFSQMSALSSNSPTQHPVHTNTTPTVAGSTTTADALQPIPTHETILPGFTSAYASMNNPMHDVEVVAGPPEQNITTLGHSETPWISRKKKPSKLSLTQKRKAAKQSSAKKKIIQPGMTVTTLMGDLVGAKQDKGRRQRERRIAKVLRSTGRNEWLVMDLNGHVEKRTSNTIKVERNLDYDSLLTKGTKLQSDLYAVFGAEKMSDGVDGSVTADTSNKGKNDDTAMSRTTADGDNSTIDDGATCTSTPSLPTLKTVLNVNDDSDDESDDSSFCYDFDGGLNDELNDGVDGGEVTDPEMEYLRAMMLDKKEVHKNREDVELSIGPDEDNIDKHDRELSAAHKVKMEDSRKKLDELIGTEITVDGHTDKKKRITWKVVKEHIAPRPSAHRHKHTLGIRNNKTLTTIIQSSLPLADMHFFLMFDDGNWWTPLGRMNAKISRFNEMQRMTNPNFRTIKLFTPFEFITCHALHICASLYIQRGVNLWSGPTDTLNGSTNSMEWKSVLPGANFKQHDIQFFRFKQFKRFVPSIWESEVMKAKNDPWWKFAWAVELFNSNRTNNILSSSDRILDESMSVFRPRTTKTGGLPNISYILRKPEPLGTEFKCVVCPITKVMIHLEIQRGKVGMSSQPHNKTLGATAGCAVRIAQRTSQTSLDGIVETVKGDAWFGSVRSVCNVSLCEKNGVGKEAFFQLKNNSRGFPKKQLKDILKNEPGGASVVLTAKDPDTGTDLLAIGYKYNTKTTLFFVGTQGAGSTYDGCPYQMKFPDKHGNICVREVPRPAVISEYFEQSNCVDIHNQLRQYALRLEKHWVTTDPYFRLHTTLTCINVVDTFRLCQFHSIFQNNHANGMTLRENLHVLDGEGESHAIGHCTENMNVMTRFVGTLCNQILLYAKRIHEPSPMHYTDSLVNRFGNSFESEPPTDIEDRYIHNLSDDDTTALVSAADDTHAMVHVLDEVYDKNGKVHQAVRHELVQLSGGRRYTQAYRCKRFDCTNKSRVKCLQCGLSYCYPIRDMSKVSKLNNCFTNHVHNIPKVCMQANSFYADLGGRK